MNHRTSTLSSWILFLIVSIGLVLSAIVNIKQSAQIYQLQRIQASMIDFQEHQYAINCHSLQMIQELQNAANSN